MKKFIFICDFDGTLTQKDFYHIVLDDYIGEEGQKYYFDWKKGNKIGYEFLNKVFAWHQFTQEEHDEILGKVQLDPYAKALFDYVENQGGDFLILSAGFEYYIGKTLKRERLEHIKVVSNPGVFEDNVFKMQPDPTQSYYSAMYGVDKERVVLEHRESYEKIYFAGDSEPDLKAALAADVVFAKGELQELLREKGRAFYPIKDFSEAIKIMKEGV